MTDCEEIFKELIENILEKTRKDTEPCAEKIISAFSGDELEGIICQAISYIELIVSHAEYFNRENIIIDCLNFTKAADDMFQRTKYHLSNSSLHFISSTIENSKASEQDETWEIIREDCLMIMDIREELSREQLSSD